MIWVEPCAGAAACALYLVGGRSLVPPVSFMGGKRRLAPLIVDALVGDARPDAIVLNDASTWGWVWPVLFGDGHRVATILRAWSLGQDWPCPYPPENWDASHARALWDWLATLPPTWDDDGRDPDPAWDAAQWLWLQARSASGVPVWWSGERHESADHSTGRVMAACQTGDPGWRMGKSEGREASQPVEQKGWASQSGQRANGSRGVSTASQSGANWMASDGRGVARPAGQKGDWRQGSGEGRAPQPMGQRGLWQMGDGLAGVRDACQKGVNRAGAGGISQPGTVADRIDRIRASGWASSRLGPGGQPTMYQAGGHPAWTKPATMGSRVAAISDVGRGIPIRCLHADASALRMTDLAGNLGDLADMVIMLDPPYFRATGYEAVFPRAEVLEFATRCKAAGAVVAVCEAEPLDLEGWHHLDLTPWGTGKSEWLTLSRPPIRVPAVQGELFQQGATP